MGISNSFDVIGINVLLNVQMIHLKDAVRGLYFQYEFVK